MPAAMNRALVRLGAHRRLSRNHADDRLFLAARRFDRRAGARLDHAADR
jgi:hypothetical protein